MPFFFQFYKKYHEDDLADRLYFLFFFRYNWLKGPSQITIIIIIRMFSWNKSAELNLDYFPLKVLWQQIFVYKKL